MSSSNVLIGSVRGSRPVPKSFMIPKESEHRTSILVFSVSQRQGNIKVQFFNQF